MFFVHSIQIQSIWPHCPLSRKKWNFPPSRTRFSRPDRLNRCWLQRAKCPGPLSQDHTDSDHHDGAWVPCPPRLFRRRCSDFILSSSIPLCLVAGNGTSILHKNWWWKSIDNDNMLPACRPIDPTWSGEGGGFHILSVWLLLVLTWFNFVCFCTFSSEIKIYSPCGLANVLSCSGMLCPPAGWVFFRI